MTVTERTAGSARPTAVAAALPAAVIRNSLPLAGGVAAVGDVAPTAAPSAPLLSSVQANAAQLMAHLQYRVARLGPAGQAGLAALTAAAALLVSAVLPAQRTVQGLGTELANARHRPVAADTAQAAPRLMASLPTRAQIPAVIGQVFAEGKGAGVSLDTGHYTYTPAKGKASARYELEFPVKASYPDIRSFIDRTLVAVPSAALGKLRFERKAVGDAVVGADIVFVVFVRAAEQT